MNRTGQVFRAKGQRSGSQQDNIWSCKDLGQHRSPVSRMHGHILMKLITVTEYQVHITMMHFQGHGLKGRGHRHFLKMHFPDGGVLIDGLPLRMTEFDVITLLQLDVVC